jgi:hypothetical protein
VILTYIVATKIGSYPMECQLHTGFHYSKLLTYLCHDYGSFSNISGMDLDGSGNRQVLN